ncbi:hypothetical protein [Pontibacillus salicampi]
MDPNRKKIVLDEIAYWKTHQLIPSEYCDFLLALYTEGTGEEPSLADSSAPINKWLSTLHVIILLVMLPISFLVIYFTEISISLQLTLLVLFIGAALGSIFYYKRYHSYYIHIAIVVFFLLLLLTSVYIAKISEMSPFVIQGAIIVNCLGWIGIGFWKRVYYLAASGIIGLILGTIYIFF